MSSNEDFLANGLTIELCIVINSSRKHCSWARSDSIVASLAGSPFIRHVNAPLHTTLKGATVDSKDSSSSSPVLTGVAGLFLDNNNYIIINYERRL